MLTSRYRTCISGLWRGRRASARFQTRASSAPDGQSPNESSPPPVPSKSTTPQGFTSLERLVATQAVQQQEAGGRTDWLEVEGCWVLRPPEAGRPRAVVFFCGGAFAGAAPQLTYRLLLECLARRNILVSAWKRGHLGYSCSVAIGGFLICRW